MKFKIFIDNAERQVDATPDGTVVIDGKSFATKVSGSGREKRTVQVGDKTYELRLVDCGEDKTCAPSEFVLELGGERVAIAVKDVLKSAPQVVTAPAASALATAAAGRQIGRRLQRRGVRSRTGQDRRRESQGGRRGQGGGSGSHP